MPKPHKKVTKPTRFRKKRRTRQHVIAMQSVVHVEKIIADAGYTEERIVNDYGYDLLLFTYDDDGYIENGNIFIQLKASDALPTISSDGYYSFQVDIKDYNTWRFEPMPFFLILFDASKSKGYWLYFQSYFDADKRREPRQGTKSISVKIPIRNKVNLRAISYMRKEKNRIIDQLKGVIDHRG